MSDNPTRPSRPPAAPDDSVAPLPVGSADPTGASPLRGVDSLAFVMDVPVELTVVIGRRAMKIGEILRLGAGSILELDKASGEPLDVFANGRLIARGEAVVVGERYGVRLTEVLVVDEGAARRPGAS